MIESGRQTFMPIRTLDLHRVEHLTLRNNFAVTYKDPYYQVWLYLDNFFFSSTTWSSNRLSRKWVSNKSRETFLILETWLKNLNGKLPFGLVTKPQFANTSVNFSWVSFFFSFIFLFILNEKWICIYLISCMLIFKKNGEMVFCYQNCSDLLWEKMVLVVKKNFWNSRPRVAKNLRSLEQFIQTVKGQNNFW